jgi:hypothetical protein
MNPKLLIFNRNLLFTKSLFDDNDHAVSIRVAHPAVNIYAKIFIHQSINP